MIKDIKVPDIGDFDEVEIIEIHVSPGEKVEIEQSLITLESDKATMEIPSPHAGIVKEINIKTGQNVSQGDLILKLETEDLSKKLGKSASHISNLIRILELEDEIHQMIISGKISMGHARALLGLEESKQMETLRNEIVKQDLTVRQTESRVNKLKKGVLDKPITQKVNKDILFLN